MGSLEPGPRAFQGEEVVVDITCSEAGNDAQVCLQDTGAKRCSEQAAGGPGEAQRHTLGGGPCSLLVL